MLEFLGSVTFPYLLALASVGLPVAALTGLVGYRELQVRLRRLPAAAEKESLESELPGLRARREELRQEIAALEGKRGELEALRVEAETWRERIHQLEAQWNDLAAMRQEVAAVQSELTRLLEQLELARAEEARLRSEASDLAARVQTLKREEAAASERLEAVQKDLDARREEAAAVHRLLEAGRQEAARLGGEVSRQRERLAETERAIQEGEKRLGDIERRIEELGRKKGELEARRDQLQREVAEVEAQYAELQQHVAERRRLAEDIKALQADRGRLEAERAALTQRIEAAKEELAGLRKKIEEAFGNLQVVVQQDGAGAESDVLAEFRERPPCFVARKARETLSEEKALEELEEHLQKRGLRYPKRVLEAFHTCLKVADISPLTVLAGISGTGKSALPRAYADALGMDYLVVPVQPRWDSPQDLLGFYNYVEGRFKATELSRALVRFDRKNWSDVVKDDGVEVSERMLLVLLDEMNLARVEYYFSDFLSLLEIRRDSPERAFVPIDLGHGRTRRLQLTDNVLYVGTMNEDESTQSLSDKVLDRANLIRFTRPRQLQKAAHATSSEPRPRLSRRIWESWRTQLDNVDDQEFEQKLAELNAILEKLGRPFGHRLFQAICRYYAAHPATRRKDPRALEIALADQLEFRILPRLRGLETDRHHEALDELRQFLEERQDEPLVEAFFRAREAEFFFWPGTVRDVENAGA